MISSTNRPISCFLYGSGISFFLGVLLFVIIEKVTELESDQDKYEIVSFSLLVLFLVISLSLIIAAVTVTIQRRSNLK